MQWVKAYNNEKGVVLIMAVVVLAAVSALGVTMITLSSYELDMATNQKVKEIARYNCDSCTVTISRLIQMVSDQSDRGVIGIAAGSSLAPGISYPAATTSMTPDEEFVHKVLFGYQGPGCEDVSFNAAAIANMVNTASGGAFTIGPNELDIAADIRATWTGSVTGTASNEFAAGYSHGLGLGGASGGGAALYFTLACRGRAPYNALHVGYTNYRNTLGVSR